MYGPRCILLRGMATSPLPSCLSSTTPMSTRQTTVDAPRCSSPHSTTTPQSLRFSNKLHAQSHGSRSFLSSPHHHSLFIFLFLFASSFFQLECWRPLLQ